MVHSGLDAFQAEKVMEALRQLAQDGHTVICSIHQPRGSVYFKFDDIVLLTEGKLVYAGPARDEPLAYFSRFGYLANPFLCCIFIMLMLYLHEDYGHHTVFITKVIFSPFFLDVFLKLFASKGIEYRNLHVKLKLF